MKAINLLLLLAAYSGLVCAAELDLNDSDAPAGHAPTTPLATELSQSLMLMTNRDGSHFATARNWLGQHMDELTAQLEFETGGARLRVGEVGITSDAKGWDIAVLGRPIFIGDRDSAIVACTSWLGELKDRMGYTAAGDPNGRQADFDGEVVGLVPLAHRHALDFKIPASSMASAYSQAGFIEAKTWVRVKVPYRSASGLNDVTCSNRLNRSSVQVSG